MHNINSYLPSPSPWHARFHQNRPSFMKDVTNTSVCVLWFMWCISLTYYLASSWKMHKLRSSCALTVRDVRTVKVDDDVADTPAHVISDKRLPISDKRLPISAIHYTSCLNRHHSSSTPTPVYTSATWNTPYRSRKVITDKLLTISFYYLSHSYSI